MSRHDEARWIRCKSVVAELNRTLGWDLSPSRQQDYICDLCTLLSDVLDTLSESKLRTMVNNYHHDHELVAILGQQMHPAHNAAWDEQIRLVAMIIRCADLDWVQDPALDSDDLRQTALIELLRALPSYRYGSRFTTWAYAVVVQRTRRGLRDRRAKKRDANMASYELRPPREVGSDTYMQPAAIVEGAMLHSLIDCILSDLYGPRMVTIFNYWVRNDMGISQISKLMQISPSRVHTLIHTARSALQHHPAIQAWVCDHGTAGMRHLAWADYAQP